MNELTRFLSLRIAEDEVRHHAALSTRSEAAPHDRYWAATGLEECESKRLTLKFHDQASKSGEDVASTAWATLNVVLKHMARPWRHHPDFKQEWEEVTE